MSWRQCWIVAVALLWAACGGGGGGGGNTDSPATILQVTQPAPPAETPAAGNKTSPDDIVAATIHYEGERDGRRTVIGRGRRPITQATLAPEPVTSSGIFDIFTAPFDLIGNIFGGGDGGSDGPSLADYFPAGDDDQWTFLDDAEILQGADPVLLFGFEPSEHAIWGFTLVAS
ncbi:MAG: hypothetical protein PVF51_01720, partial [Nitrospirota bacterium]